LGRARQANSVGEAEEWLKRLNLISETKMKMNEDENANGSERQGWKVMELGLAWYWLLTSGT
jgi:hypothetical protein